jgi:hypothetical protein
LPTYAEIPFEFEVDTATNFEHLNYAADRFSDLRGAFAEQHYIRTGKGGGHFSEPIAVSTGRLILPTDLTDAQKFEGDTLRPRFSRMLTGAKLYWTGGSSGDTIAYIVVLTFDYPIYVLGIHASIPTDNGRTVVLGQTAPACYPGKVARDTRIKDRDWVVAFPCISTRFEGSYLNFAAWGFREE